MKENWGFGTNEKTAKVLPVAEPASAPVRPGISRPRRILMVDDDPLIRQLSAEGLTDTGYLVDVALDGAEAWDKLQLNQYDLLITDNNMPNVTGVELLRLVHDARMALLVIMATGTSPKEEFDRHPGLHPAALLLKPYALEELLAAVAGVLHANSRIFPPPSPA